MMQRSAYFDFLRGIAILMVIAIHTFPPVTFDGTTRILQIYIRQLVGCPVPLFLALSGFFLGRKELTSKESRIIFWRKQIPKVYIPALIWSLPLFAISVRQCNNPVSQIVILFCMGFSIYYFVALIIQCYFLLPLLQKIDFGKWGGVICCMSIICGFVIAWCGVNKFPLILYAGPFTTWIMFFCLGMCLGKIKRDYSLRPLAVGAIISTILMILEGITLNKLGKNGLGLKPTVYIYSTFMILILFSQKVQVKFEESKLINRFVSYIGRISFGIYLTHCYIIMIVNRILGNSLWIINWVVVTMFSIIIIMAMRKSLPSNLLKYLGFR